MGCGDSAAGLGNVPGTYTMRSVNGSSPPVSVLVVPGYTLQLVSGDFVINANHTYVATTVYREIESGQTTTTTDVCTGTYTLRTNSLTFSETVSGLGFCGGTYPGTFNGNSITISRYDDFWLAVYST